MIQSTQSFTQSLRLLDPINQKRIKLRQRILWPDYEILNLLNNFSKNSQHTDTQMDLTNLFLYCPFEDNFIVKKTNKTQYLNLKQLYSDQFTHLAFWVCKQDNHSQRNKLVTRFTQNILLEENRRQKSLQKVYRTKQKVTKPQQIYVVLCKRPIAIDEIVKTPHKVCISVVPLSGQKFLWGGALHYEEFESFEHDKKEQRCLFKTGGENFGFKIDSKPSFVLNSYRKSNGLIDKRQRRYSNYFKTQKEEPKSIQTQKVRKQCNNKFKILPQHIRQHQQLLYIQIDLDNNTQLPQRSDQYQFMSVDIYARHLKPKYGGVYEKQSTSSDSDDEFNELKGALNKYKRLLKQEIFLVYSMPFMEFNSYLESQLNYEQSQQLRQINFRGSCLMFSAMKNLQLKSSKKSQNQEDKQKQLQLGSYQKNKKHRYMEIQQQRKPFQKEEKSIKSDVFNTEVKGLIKQKEIIQIKDIKKSQYKQKIQLVAESFNDHKQQHKLPKRQIIKNVKIQIINELCKRLKQNEKNEQNQQQQLFVPVFNPEGFQPLRIGIDIRLMRFLNRQINKITTKVFVQGERIKKQYSKDIEMQWAGDKNRKRVSVYVGKNRGEVNKEKQSDLIGIDVFLTDKVYKQETVYMLINILKKLDTLKQTNNHNIESEQLMDICQIQGLKNILTLLNDIKGQDKCQQNGTCDLIRLVLWIQMLQKMNLYTQRQLQMIREVQKLTYQLVQQTQKLSLKNSQQSLQKDLIQKQQLIIKMIKDYHYKYRVQSQQCKLYLNFFFYFFTTQVNESSSIINYSLSKQISTNVNQNQQKINAIQQVFNEFLLINCKLMLQSNSLHLSTILLNLSKQINYQNNIKLLSQRDLLCQFLETSITYVIENLFTIPINIFLSQPLQQFQQQSTDYQFINEGKQQQFEFVFRQQKRQFDYKNLRRFLKKYFIKGHNFLDRQANQSLIDADNIYINLITDLLNIFIKLSNIQVKQKDNDDDFNEHKQISNVIELIQDQYSKCLITNQVMKFYKFLKNNRNNNNNYAKKLINQQLQVFEKNQYNEQIKLLIERKQQQILTNHNNQWKLNNLTYLVKSNEKRSQQQKQYIIIQNDINKPIQLSIGKNNHCPKYDFNLIIQQTDQTHQIQSYISFNPSKSFNNNINDNFTQNNSYSIDMVKTYMALNYHQNQHQINDNKSLFTCYQVFVDIQITTNKSFSQKQKTLNKNQQQFIMNDVNKIVLKGSNLLNFQNFNHTQINKNQIQLHLTNQQKQILSCQLNNIQKVNIKIYSKKLPILSASLSFINLRLGKYFKNLLKKSINQNSRKSTIKSTNRKTIGGRYTQHLNNRKSVLSIQQNIFFGQSERKLKNNNKIQTLFDLPETLLFDILRVDKSYIQDQQKILHFIDEFYQRNQPQYDDYILYLCLRPNFIRVSTILKHFFANRIKYDDSKILNSIIKTKLSSSLTNKNNQSIAKLIIKKPRISSYKPLKNIIDTNEQRQLLNKYMKDLTRKNSIHKNQPSQSLSKSNLFTKKSIFQVKQQRKQNFKDF